MNSSLTKKSIGFIITVVLVACLLLIGIATTGRIAYAEGTEKVVVNRIGHVSDVHVMPIQYCNQYSNAFIAASGGTKIIHESESSLETTLQEIYDMGDEAPMYIISSGDLSSDAEYDAHVIVAETFRQFTQKMRARTDTTVDFSNFQIFVVPGNHDMYNSSAVSYMPSQEEIDECNSVEEVEDLIRNYTSRSVKTTTSKDIFEIYSDFGYCNCEGRKEGHHDADCGMVDGCKVSYLYESEYWYDETTERINNADGTVTYKGFDVTKPSDEEIALFEEGKDFEYIAEAGRIGICSYVAEINGVTILGVDGSARKYEGVKEGNLASEVASGWEETTGGLMTRNMLRWFIEETEDDVENDNICIVNCHYNMIPHFETEDEVISLFVLDNWEQVVSTFAKAGIRYGFTGHQHSNDFVDYVTQDGYVFYDSESGSLVSYGACYKICDFTQTFNVGGKKDAYAEDFTSTTHFLYSNNDSDYFYYDIYMFESDVTLENTVLGEQGAGNVVSNELYAPVYDIYKDRTYLYDDCTEVVLVKDVMRLRDGTKTDMATALTEGLADLGTMNGIISNFINDGLYDRIRGALANLDWKYTKNLVLGLIDGLENLDLYQFITSADGKSFKLSKEPKAGYDLVQYAEDLALYLTNYDFGYGEFSEKVTLGEIVVIVYGAHLSGASNAEVHPKVQPLLEKLRDGTFVNFLIDTIVDALVPQLQLIFDAPIRFNAETTALADGKGFDVVEEYNSSSSGTIDNVVKMVLTGYCFKETDNSGYSSLTYILKDVSKILETILLTEPSEIDDPTLKLLAQVANPLLEGLGDIGSIVDMVMTYLNQYFETGSLYTVLEDALLSKYVTDAFCRNLGEYGAYIVGDLAVDHFDDGAKWIEGVDYLTEFMAEATPNYKVYTKQYDAEEIYKGHTYYSSEDGINTLTVPATSENGLLASMVTVSFDGDVTTGKKIQWFTSIETNVFDKNDKGEYEYSVPESYIEYSTDKNLASSTVVKADGINEEREIPTIDLGIMYLNMTYRAKVYNKYTVKLSSLKEGTTYYYRVGSDKYGWTEINSFSTAKADGGFSFTAITDIQGSVKSNYVNSAPNVELAVGEGTDFIVSCGDNVDNGKSIYQYTWWLDEQKSTWRNNTLVTLAGNHEDENYSLSNVIALPDEANVSEVGYYYSYDYQNTHFVIVDTNDLDAKNQLAKAQLKWLKEDLQKNNENEKTQWTVVMLHKGLYTAGSHAFDADVSALRKQLTPVFAEYGVDVVLQGHDHTYSVSEYILADGKKEEVAYDKKGYAKDPQGVLYINLGTMGDKYYDYIYNEQVILKERKEAPKGLEEYFNDGKLELTETPVYATVNVNKGKMEILTYTIVDGNSVLVDELKITKAMGFDVNNLTQDHIIGVAVGVFTIGGIAIIFIVLGVAKKKRLKK